MKLERPRVFFASVFNAEQIDGMPAQNRGEKHDWNPVERAEKILEASGANINIKGQDRAFYRPSTDSIHLPEKDQFPTPDNFYATALHELGHWTGHNSRLDRDLIHPFGSEGYAKEELRAEISSMMMGEEIGIGHDPEQHAAYVGSWIKVLKEDHMEIFRAASDAEKIQGYILGLEQRQEQELAQEQKQENLEPVLFQLADNKETYGEEAGHWVVVTNDSETELSMPYASEEWANERRSGIDEAAKAHAAFKASDGSIGDFQTALRDLDPSPMHELHMDDAESWNGAIQVKPVKYFHDTNMKTGEPITFIDEVPQNEAEAFDVFMESHDKPSRSIISFDSEEEAQALAAELEGVSTQSGLYQAQLNNQEQTKAQQETVVADAKLAEETVKNNPESTEGEILAAKKHSSDAATALDEMASRDIQLLDKALQAAESQTAERTYIDVPFKEKEQAKALGAKWERNESGGSWFVPPGEDAGKFSQWPVKEKAQISKAVDSKKEGRVYLAVPYDDRKAAKRAGAKWDKGAKSWFAEAGADMQTLKKWMPSNTQSPEQVPSMNPREEFSDVLKSMGCVVDGKHPVMDGTKQRIKVEGDKGGKTAGFYVVHMDGHPAGYIKNNKTQEETRWKAKGYSLTPEEKANMQAVAAEKLKQRAEEQARVQEEVSKKVAKQLDGLSPVVKPTPYMESKQIKPTPEVFTDNGNKTTFIPVHDVEGKQWATQYIQEDGTKRFPKGSRKEGCFHAVGGMDSLAKAPAIVVAEGYATAATLSEELGHSTVAAFDAGNLPTVAKELQGKFPEKPIIIAADDDYSQEQVRGKNPGKEKAKEAADAVKGCVVVPVFAPGEQTGSPKSFTDFNDLATKSSLGRDGVRRQVKGVVDRELRKRREQVVRERQERVKRQERRPKAVRV